MKNSFTLFGWLIRRLSVRHILSHWIASLLLSLAVALGVSVFVAIVYASGASVAAFRRSAELIGGPESAQLLSRTPVWTQQQAAQIIPFLAADFNLTPVLELAVKIQPRAGEQHEFMLLGVDPISAQSHSSQSANFSQVFRTGKESINTKLLAIDAAAAESFGFRAGEMVSVAIGSQTIPAAFEVFIIEHSERPLGRSGIVEISYLQEISQNSNRISYLVLNAQASDSQKSFEKKIKSLRATLLESSEDSQLNSLYIDDRLSSRKRAESLIAAFRFNIFSLVLMALLVCVATIFHAAQLGSLGLARQLGLLRLLGLGRVMVWGLLLSESLMIGLLGAAIGTIFGRDLAEFIGRVFMRTALSLYARKDLSSIDDQIAIVPMINSLSFWCGCAVCMFGSAYPFWKASSKTAHFGLSSIDSSGANSQAKFSFSVVGVLALLGSLGAAYFAKHLETVALAHVSALLLIFSLFSLAPRILSIILKITRPMFIGLRVTGLIAYNSLVAAKGLHGFSVAVSSAGMCLLVGLGIMISSFRATLSDWIDYSLKADVYIRAQGASGTVQHEIQADLIDSLREIPEIEEIATLSSFNAEFRGKPLLVQGISSQTAKQRQLYRLLSGSIAPASLKHDNRALISENASRRFALQLNQEIVINQKNFRIEGIFKDFANEHGTVVLDQETLERNFGKLNPSDMSLYFKPQIDSVALLEKVRRIAQPWSVHVTALTDLRNSIFKIFDNTFAVTEVLRIIVAVLCALGAAVSSLQVVWERRRELKTVLTIGMSPAQLKISLVLEFVLLAASACLIGGVAGIFLSGILINLVNPLSFGWSLGWLLKLNDFVKPALVLFLAHVVLVLIPFGAQQRILKGARLCEE